MGKRHYQTRSRRLECSNRIEIFIMICPLLTLPTMVKLVLQHCFSRDDGVQGGATSLPRQTSMLYLTSLRL